MRKSLALCIALTCGGAGHLRADETDELFQRLDKNSDGQIAADEVDGDGRRLFERLLRNGDKNQDGRLNRDEFAAASKDAPPPAPEAGRGGPGGRPGPREILQQFDKNGDGKLDKSEAPERLRENWERADRNSDGAVSPEELLQLFQGLRPAGKPSAKPGEKPGEKPAEKPGDRPLDTPRPKPDQAARPLGFQLPPVLAVLDADRDGELSREEIAAASQALASLDKNQDGKLTRDEMFPNLPNAAEGGLRMLLNRLKEADADQNGKLSREEAPDRLKPQFDRLDANGDGQLDESELRAMAERLGGQRRPEGATPRQPDEAKK